MPLKKIVKIIANGQEFSIFLKTISKFPNSELHNLVTQENWDLSNAFYHNQTIYIDTDPQIFRYIINYMKGYTIDYSTLSKMKLSMLHRDAVLFKLNDFAEQVEQFLPQKPSNGEIENARELIKTSFLNLTTLFSPLLPSILDQFDLKLIMGQILSENKKMVNRLAEKYAGDNFSIELKLFSNVIMKLVNILSQTLEQKRNHSQHSSEDLSSHSSEETNSEEIHSLLDEMPELEEDSGSDDDNIKEKLNVICQKIGGSVKEKTSDLKFDDNIISFLEGVSGSEQTVEEVGQLVSNLQEIKDFNPSSFMNLLSNDEKIKQMVKEQSLIESSDSEIDESIVGDFQAETNI